MIKLLSKNEELKPEFVLKRRGMDGFSLFSLVISIFTKLGIILVNIERRSVILKVRLGTIVMFKFDLNVLVSKLGILPLVEDCILALGHKYYYRFSEIA